MVSMLIGQQVLANPDYLCMRPLLHRISLWRCSGFRQSAVVLHPPHTFLEFVFSQPLILFPVLSVLCILGLLVLLGRLCQTMHDVQCQDLSVKTVLYHQQQLLKLNQQCLKDNYQFGRYYLDHLAL